MKLAVRTVSIEVPKLVDHVLQIWRPETVECFPHFRAAGALAAVDADDNAYRIPHYSWDTHLLVCDSSHSEDLFGDRKCTDRLHDRPVKLTKSSTLGNYFRLLADCYASVHRKRTLVRSGHCDNACNTEQLVAKVELVVVEYLLQPSP